MTKQRLLGAALALLVVLNIATLFLLARRPAHPDGPPPEDRPMHLVIERLQLTDDQVAAYRELIAAHRASIGHIEQEMRSVRGRLFQGIGAADVAQRDSLTARIATLQAEIERTHVDHFAAVRALCRQEQLARFDALMAELSEHFGRRPPRGPRP